MEPERASRDWARSRVRVVVVESLVEGLTGGLRVLLSPFTASSWRRRVHSMLSRSVSLDDSTRPVPSGARVRRIFLVAGEPSGDQRAADLVRAVRAIDGEATFEGLGGPRMREAGVRLHARMDPHPVMGFLSVIRQVGTFARLLVDVLVRLRRDPPDALVLVDYPGFNLRLARAARPLRVPTIAYVAPQVWAWAPWRIPTVARSVDLILCILPFEPPLFAGTRTRAVFTGHPLMERLKEVERSREFGDDAIGLLPGSRRGEVERLLPLMLATAERLRTRFPDARFVVPAAGRAVRGAIDRILASSAVPVEVVEERVHERMARLRTALVASGTATLELGLLGVPMVVVYPLGRIQRLLRHALLIAPHFALVNIVAGREIVEERFIGRAASEAEGLAESLGRLHEEGPERDRVRRDLDSVRARLRGRGAARRAAEELLEAARPGWSSGLHG